MERIANIFQQQRPQVKARTAKEDLINQIASQTTENTPELRRRIALAVNTLGWTEIDLHALLKKKQDPTIRNYTAFVKWSTKIPYKKSP